MEDLSGGMTKHQVLCAVMNNLGDYYLDSLEDAEGKVRSELYHEWKYHKGKPYYISYHFGVVVIKGKTFRMYDPYGAVVHKDVVVAYGHEEVIIYDGETVTRKYTR